MGGERVTCHWSKLHDALGGTKLHDALGQQQLELSTQVVHVETAANLYASRRQAYKFLSVYCSILSWEV